MDIEKEVASHISELPIEFVREEARKNIETAIDGKQRNKRHNFFKTANRCLVQETLTRLGIARLEEILIQSPPKG